MSTDRAARSVLAAFDHALSIITSRQCPYCDERYEIAESLRHLTSERCIAAQRRLRNQPEVTR